MSSPRYAVTLGIHPTSSGFAWIAFEGPFAPYDWGIASAGKDKNASCLRKIERILGRLPVETLVLEQFEGAGALRSARIVRLCRAIVALAADRGVDVAVHTGAEIKACFATAGARSRQEIAEAVVRHIDVFRHRLPKRRRAWDSEDRRMALFSASALGLTYYRTASMRLLAGIAQNDNETLLTSMQHRPLR